MVQQVVGELVLLAEQAECQRGYGIDAPRVEQMGEELLAILGEVGWNSSEQLAAQCFVEWTARDGKGQRLDHVLDENEISHILKDGGELHEDLLWLDTVAQAVDDLIYLLLVEFLLVHVHALDHHSTEEKGVGQHQVEKKRVLVTYRMMCLK